jgi:CBS-domain-containing membrane protein
MKRWYVSDVMTRDVVSVDRATGYKEIADLMVSHGVSALPVVDPDGVVLGVVSEADLLLKLEYADRVPRHPLATRRTRAGRQKADGDTAGDLMTAPAVTIAPTESVTRAARLMDAAKVKRMPVVDESGRLIGIVSRRDLVRIYTRSDREILAGVTQGVLRSLWIDPASLNIEVEAGIVTLAGEVDRRSTADIVLAFVRATPGVVDVVGDLSWRFDDRDTTGFGWYQEAGQPAIR